MDLAVNGALAAPLVSTPLKASSSISMIALKVATVVAAFIALISAITLAIDFIFLPFRVQSYADGTEQLSQDIRNTTNEIRKRLGTPIPEEKPLIQRIFPVTSAAVLHVNDGLNQYFQEGPYTENVGTQPARKPPKTSNYNLKLMPGLKGQIPYPFLISHGCFSEKELIKQGWTRNGTGDHDVKWTPPNLWGGIEEAKTALNPRCEFRLHPTIPTGNIPSPTEQATGESDTGSF